MGLTGRQQQLLDVWLPSAAIVRDHSWGLIGTLVLELEHHGQRYIAKAGDSADHHLAREIRAHRNWLQPWTTCGRAAELIHADEDAKLLLTRFLPGEPAWPPSSSAPTRASSLRSSPATAPTRVNQQPGTAPGSGKQSARRCGPTRSETNPSNSKDTE